MRAMRATASTLAPPAGWKPVDVLTKSAPARSAASQQPTICASVRAADSMITLSTTGARQARRTAAMSASTPAQSPATTSARSTTMSTSSAPSRTARAASAALTSLWCAPEGKPQTVATCTPAGTCTGSRLGDTQME